MELLGAENTDAAYGAAHELGVAINVFIRTNTKQE